MKETIYTIPINDAYDSDFECPICFIHNHVAERIIVDTLGASMMEPDFRIITNDKGFCPACYAALLKQGNPLSMALVLQTHLSTQIDRIFRGAYDTHSDQNLLLEKPKPKRFGWGKRERKTDTVAALDALADSCAICDAIDAQLEQFMRNIVHLWQKEPDFKRKFDGVRAYCLPHASLLLKAGHTLNAQQHEVYSKTIIDVIRSYSESLLDDVTAFANAHNHNAAPLSERQADSVRRGVWFVSGISK